MWRQGGDNAAVVELRRRHQERREVAMKTAGEQAASGPGRDAVGRALVDRHWLDEHLLDPQVRIVEVDVSPAAYNDWHIDGAVLWNIYADLKDAAYRTAGLDALQRLV